MEPVTITNPADECYISDGVIDKRKYIEQMEPFNRHYMREAKKLCAEFLEKNPSDYYFVNLLDTDFGCILKYVSKDPEKFWDCLVETWESVIVDVTAFNYVDDRKISLEIWGKSVTGDGKILIIYPYEEFMYKC